MRKDHAEIVKPLVQRETRAAETAMMNHLHHVGFDLMQPEKMPGAAMGLWAGLENGS
jgi:DNA-binding FadR family transcriptional regulator